MAVLDLGAGTGNLAELFVRLGCSLWCTDFSTEMLARAREKVPTAQCLVHDLRQPLPPELDRRFDRIVSAYVFHHFELSEKVSILRRLASRHLAQNGRIVIADLSFQTPQALQAARQAAGDAWDEEPYWIAQAALPALEKVGLAAAYTQVSEVAGVYQVSARENPVSPF
jgi:putative AdoMet-dependent methyltransferase